MRPGFLSSTSPVELDLRAKAAFVSVWLKRARKSFAPS
jgi:hypothetical protein